MFIRYFGLLSVILSIMALTVPLSAQETGSALDTIVVSASRLKETLRSVTGSVSVITSEDIEKSSATDVATILAQQGFNYLGYGDSKFIQIRGMHTNTNDYENQARVLVLINGRRVGSARINTFGLSNVERIEIVRGPSAVQYGPSAVGGVINVITKRGTEGEFHLSVESGVGSYDSVKEKFAVSGAVSGFDYSLGLNYTSRKNDYEISGGQKYPGTSTPDNTTMDLELGYTFLEKHRIGLSYVYSNLHTNSYNSFSGLNPADFSAPTIKSSYYDYETRSIAFTYEGATPSDMFDWLVRYSFGNTEEDSVWSTETNIKTKGFQAQIGYNSSILDVDLGVDWNSYSLKNESSMDYKQDDLGIYVASKVKLLDDRLFFSIGGRYDKYSVTQRYLEHNKKSYTKFIPSVGIAYLPVPFLKFRVNYSEGFIMPNAQQITGSSGWSITDPNPNIGPEQSKTLELGADLDWRYLNMSLTYFHTDWTDKLISIPNPANPGHYIYTNLPKSEIAGIEFFAKADLGEAFGYDFVLEPRIGLTYYTTLKTKWQDANNRYWVRGYDGVPYVPKYTINYGITFMSPKYDLTMDLNGVYMGKELSDDYRQGAVTQVFMYTPGTTSVDLSIEKGLMTFGANGEGGKLSIRVEVNNMFDNRNETYLDYPGPGRNFYIGLKYQL